MIENTYAILIELQTTDLRSSNEFETDLKQKRSKARKKICRWCSQARLLKRSVEIVLIIEKKKKSFKRLEKRSE